jgi:hypothetical protein
MNKKITIEIDTEAAREYADWLWSWFAYDTIDADDKIFRTTANIVWQIRDQIEEAK